MSAFGSDCIRALMAQGLDTLAIAQRIGCSEANIWNLLARGSDHARPTLRLAGATGSPPMTAPGASAPGGFSPVVVREPERLFVQVQDVVEAGTAHRAVIGRGVHRFGSGGIGPQ